MKALLMIAVSTLAMMIGQAKADYIFTTFDTSGSSDILCTINSSPVTEQPCGTPYPNGINDSGQIVGNFGNGQGFIDTNGIFTVINIPSSQQTIPNAISNSGEVVGSFLKDFPGCTLCGEQGFSYNDGTFSTISYPGAISTYAMAVNDAGQITGEAMIPVLGEPVLTTIEIIFLDDNGVYSSLGDPTMENAIQQFPWIAVGLSLEFPGACSTIVSGGNDDGAVVGRYTTCGNGNIIGFVATPVSEPSGLAMVGIGLLGLGYVKHKKSLV